MSTFGYLRVGFSGSEQGMGSAAGDGVLAPHGWVADDFQLVQCRSGSNMSGLFEGKDG